MFANGGNGSGGRLATRRLTTTEERALILRAKGRDPVAREHLVEAFLPLVATIARRYRGTPGLDREELLQEGVVGLLRALERFDLGLETPFWAYAAWWVRQAMQQLVCDLGRPVVLSDRAARTLARMQRAKTEHLRTHGSEPTAIDIAEATGVEREHVESLLVAERRARGLDELLNVDRPSSDTLGAQLPDPRAEDAYEGVQRRAEVERLSGLLCALTERELAIVRGRYGLNGRERTLRELAGVLGISAERVRQIEQSALGKLRDAAG